MTEPRALLGAWQLSVVLMLAAAVFYVLLTIYSWTVPSHVVMNIAGMSMFWIVWSLLLINTFVCIANRWRRARWSTVLLHGSFFLIAIGLLLSRATRAESKLWVAQGETFRGEEGQYLARDGDIAPPPFTLRSIAPKFWRDQLLFTNLEAVLDFDGRARATKINAPLVLSPATFLRLSGFGFAPRYELLDRDGRVLDSSFAKLNVFPPGQRDFLMAESLPYRVYVELYPDAELRDGKAVNRTMNLARPLLVTRVWRGHVPIASVPLRLNEELSFEGVRLRFPEVRFWGELTIVRDAGVPLFFLGGATALAGLVLRLWSSR